MSVQAPTTSPAVRFRLPIPVDPGALAVAALLVLGVLFAVATVVTPFVA